jgi:hypothetical protein
MLSAFSVNQDSLSRFIFLFILHEAANMIEVPMFDLPCCLPARETFEPIEKFQVVYSRNNTMNVTGSEF